MKKKFVLRLPGSPCLVCLLLLFSLEGRGVHWTDELEEEEEEEETEYEKKEEDMEKEEGGVGGSGGESV